MRGRGDSHAFQHFLNKKNYSTVKNDSLECFSVSFDSQDEANVFISVIEDVLHNFKTDLIKSEDNNWFDTYNKNISKFKGITMTNNITDNILEESINNFTVIRLSNNNVSYDECFFYYSGTFMNNNECLFKSYLVNKYIDKTTIFKSKSDAEEFISLLIKNVKEKPLFNNAVKIFNLRELFLILIQRIEFIYNKKVNSQLIHKFLNDEILYEYNSSNTLINTDIIRNDASVLEIEQNKGLPKHFAAHFDNLTKLNIFDSNLNEAIFKTDDLILLKLSIYKDLEASIYQYYSMKKASELLIKLKVFSKFTETKLDDPDAFKLLCDKLKK